MTATGLPSAVWRRRPPLTDPGASVPVRPVPGLTEEWGSSGPSGGVGPSAHGRSQSARRPQRSAGAEVARDCCLFTDSERL